MLYSYFSSTRLNSSLGSVGHKQRKQLKKNKTRHQHLLNIHLKSDEPQHIEQHNAPRSCCVSENALHVIEQQQSASMCPDDVMLPKQTKKIGVVYNYIIYKKKKATTMIQAMRACIAVFGQKVSQPARAFHAAPPSPVRSGPVRSGPVWSLCKVQINKVGLDHRLHAGNYQRARTRAPAGRG